VIKHLPIGVASIRDLVSYLLVWGFFEALVWILAFLISEQNRPRLAVVLGRIGRIRHSMTRRGSLAVAAVFVLVFVGRLALLPILPVPAPRVVDEFSQLLSADTFASGRVTNPTHPMWFYFETFMENEKPTYHSMYPPANGAFMAAAQVLTGQPWFGVLFSVAAASAAMCWMLQGWVPRRWALWGTLVFVLSAARNQLTDSYFGEGVAVLGGALVLGAVPRIIKKSSLGAAIWLGIGIALLAASRPYEGMFFVVGICCGAIAWACAAGIKTRALFWRVASPVVAILLPALLAVGYVNWRTTGSPILAPYQLNLEQQHITRPLVWQKPLVPHYDHPVMAAVYGKWELDWWKATRGFPRGVVLFLADKATMLYTWVLWPLSVLVLIGAYQLIKNRSKRFLPLALAFFLVGLCLETYQLLSRYAAPAWGLVILLGVYGIRYIAVSGRENHQTLRVSDALAILIPCALLIGAVLTPGYRVWRRYPEPWYAARQEILKTLENLPGKQLVIVRYSPSHPLFEEWVYNRADIDAAKVVWARDSADRGDADLLRYFADRRVWLLEPDGTFPKLTPYCVNGSDSAVGFASTSLDSRATIKQIGPFPASCCVQSCASLHDKAGVAR
jgi:nitrate reductase gamma subunit